jgi:hypothetical protein
MFRQTKRFNRLRRGGTLVLAVIGLTTVFTVLGMEMDMGRLAVTRHKDQVIADSLANAGAQELPYQAKADAAIDRVVRQYQTMYNRTFSVDRVYSGPAGRPNRVQITVRETVPMFVPALMGFRTRAAEARASASTFVPTQNVGGLVPIGVQYDRTFFDSNWLQSGSNASDTEVLLKLGNGDKKEAPGNTYPLDFGGSGADDWRQWLKWGYSGTKSVHDIVQTETGNMTGPARQALALASDGGDSDSRFQRAAVSDTYASDSWSSFHGGNSHIVILPLVDWKSLDKGGKANIEILGFASFYVTRVSSGEIYGRFVRYVDNSDGSDSSGSPDDTGLYISRMVE